MANINLKSKLLNLSELARRLNVKPTTFYNRVKGIGKHKPLTAAEQSAAEQILEIDLLTSIKDLL
jgi:hypothetical protein